MIGFKKLINAKALYQTQDKIWVAKGMKFFAVDYTGKRVSNVYTIFQKNNLIKSVSYIK